MAQAVHQLPGVRIERLLKNRRGDIYVEYIVVLALFALPVAITSFRLGLPLLRLSRFAQLAFGGPFP
jgi:hypothetical protein